MCTRALVLLFILNVCIGPAFAYQDWYIMNQFGNVRTRIVGHYYQVAIEPSKARVIGELAQRLAAELGYTEPVLLDLNSRSAFDFSSRKAWLPPQFLVSFDDGGTPPGNGWLGDTAVLESPGIVIRQCGGPLAPAAILTLLEYAINNTGKIQSEQRLQEFDRRRISSIDFAQIQEVLRRPISPATEKAWKTRVLVPYTKSKELPNPAGIWYGFENGLFVVYRQNEGAGGTPLLSVKDIYDFKELSFGAVVFDTKESFYYVRGGLKSCSRRHVIEDTRHFPELYGRYEVVPLGYDGVYDKIAIGFGGLVLDEQTGNIRGFRKRNYRVLIYSLEHDQLIQDLNEVFDKMAGMSSNGEPPGEQKPEISDPNDERDQ